MSIPENIRETINDLYGEPRAAAQPPLQPAAVAAAEQLYEQADIPLSQDRLSKALDLVLSNAVTLHLDGTATVRSGGRAYEIAGKGCGCADAKQRGAGCKHQLAVEIHRRTAALLQDATPTAASRLRQRLKTGKAAPGVTSTRWQ